MSPKKHPAAISAGHEVTLEVAESILEIGGNAFDAAISAFLAMFITEPCMASIGAGGFAMCYHHQEKRPKILDFFTQTPRSKNHEGKLDFFPITVEFGEETEEFQLGMASIATPGAIAAIYEIHEKYGSLPMSVLIDACDHLAKDGVRINTFQAYDIGLLQSVFAVDNSVKDIFFTSNGILQEGDLLHMPELSNFYQFLKDEGRKGIYEGEISKIIHNASINGGGFIRRSDFENYNCFWRYPNETSIPQSHCKLFSPSYPSLGGMIMTVLSHLRKEEKKTWIEATIEIKEKYSKLEDLTRKLESITNQKINHHGMPNLKGTSHFNIVDQWGNAISLTTSLGEGSGYFVPGTNLQMNNMLGEDYLLPDGFHSWKADQRMMSMMAPSLVLDGNHLRYIGGSGGAGRIPYAIMQVVENIFSEGMSLKKATESDRIVVHGNTIHCEGMAHSNSAMDCYQTRNWNKKSMFFGGVHSILIQENRIEANGDPRRYGVAKVLS